MIFMMNDEEACGCTKSLTKAGNVPPEGISCFSSSLGLICRVCLRFALGFIQGLFVFFLPPLKKNVVKAS